MKKGLFNIFRDKIVLLIGAASIVALSIFISIHYDNRQEAHQDTASADVLRGDTKAQMSLGTMYLRGGMGRDDYDAAGWFQKAAKRGNASAQYNLAIMYEKRRAVFRDYAKALNWYRKSASQNYAKAQFGLARMHKMGLGTPKDTTKAERWYRLAAEQGHLARIIHGAP